jgi:predicted MFS family arabinose efflux permease
VAQTGAVSAFLLIMVTYFRDIGYPATTATAMPLAVGMLQILSRLALAPLARRYGMTRVTAVAFALQALGLLTLPLAGTSIPVTIACVAAFGAGYGIGVVARPSIVADAFGVARFASILAVTTVPIALSRAGAPLLAAWLADWRFLVLLGTATLLAAAALVPASRQAGVATPANTVPCAGRRTADFGQARQSSSPHQPSPVHLPHRERG